MVSEGVGVLGGTGDGERGVGVSGGTGDHHSHRKICQDYWEEMMVKERG